MTMQQLLWQGVQELNKARVPDPELDARYLLLEVFHLNLASFLALKARGLGEDEETEGKCREFMRLIEARAGRTPLQHLTGTQEFMGFEFLVNEHVLIPRQDTETLVELVLEEQKDREKRVLDMCTGSGCIAISLALMGRYRHVAAWMCRPRPLRWQPETVTGFWADTMADLNCLRAICSALWGRTGPLMSLSQTRLISPAGS